MKIIKVLIIKDKLQKMNRNLEQKSTQCLDVNTIILQFKKEQINEKMKEIHYILMSLRKKYIKQ